MPSNTRQQQAAMSNKEQTSNAEEAEKTANLLNKIKITKKTAPRTSMVGGAINWMLSAFPSSNPAPERQNLVEERDDADERDTNEDRFSSGVRDTSKSNEEAAKEVEHPGLDASARNLNHSGELSPRKRKRSIENGTDDSPRAYSLKTVSDGDLAPTEPLPKRLSRKRVAKKPIVAATTSLNPVSEVRPVTRSRSTVPVVEIEVESSVTPQNLIENGRGRRTKAHTLESERQQGVTILSAPGNDNAESNNSEKLLEDNDSTSWMPANRSPEKVTMQPWTGREYYLASAEQAKRAHRLEATSADEDDMIQDEDDVQNSNQEVARPELFPFSLAPAQIEELMKISDRVGQRYHMSSDSYDKIISVSLDKLNDETGKELSAIVDSLSTAYENLQASILKGRRNLTNKAYANVSSRLEDLRASTRNAVLSIRGTGIDDNTPATEKLLICLYFIVLPQWMRCIQLALNTCSEEGKMSLELAEEIYSLCKLWCDLAGVATAQKVKLSANDVTPFDDKISNNDDEADNDDTSKKRRSNFQIKQPTTESLTQLRKLCMSHRVEIDAIKKRAKDLMSASQQAIRMETEERARDSLRQADLEAKEISRNEQEERRATLMRKKNQETLARRRAVHRKQRQDVDRIKRELMGNYGLSAGDDRLYGSQGASIRTRRNVESDESDLEEENDPLSNGYKVRIGGFPPDNKRGTTRTPWNNEKKGRFAMMMMQEAEDPNRWQNAARALDVDIEEVFEAAKELQQCLHRVHERGKMLDQEWTYNVWWEDDDAISVPS
ncbi:hypothetical protein GLAREA_01476 [Glarea lozoyensis ATCC 20868]|uniref:Uncharacterized protein n=1 Tax=Glarea lozoyensis (strain ATCC 20868 / MF5171) TaxID=1116229 RepID=S3CK05_GLAL2|nr:uncharacterized protein GLAREA_01476 [Glarea lozoyensis ATCC 20868]EPE25564.1 hypothetical protein GLAREA_01476 [Glarea lozoyensis ATCC 20868]